MFDTGKATINNFGNVEKNIIKINIYYGGELSDTDMKDIYHNIIKEYDTPVNILCTRNKDNVYSSDAADYIRVNSKHLFNKIACIADDQVTIDSFNNSKDILFKENQTELFNTKEEGYLWLKE